MFPAAGWTFKHQTDARFLIHTTIRKTFGSEGGSSSATHAECIEGTITRPPSRCTVEVRLSTGGGAASQKG